MLNKVFVWKTNQQGITRKNYNKNKKEQQAGCS